MFTKLKKAMKEVIREDLSFLQEKLKDKDEVKKEQKKERYKTHLKNSKKKGDDYEKFVAKHYEDLGYIVKFNGIEKGKKDSSIDLIAIKQNEIILVQCKDWNEKGKYKINHEKIKAFIGDTHTFILKNKNYEEYNIKRIFAVSGMILDKSAVQYIKANKEVVRYLHLPTRKRVA